MSLYEDRNIKPMLISEMQDPFNSVDYIYELKLDGLRAIVYLDETSTDIRNKRNLKLLPKFPELTDLHLQINKKCIIDGELVVLKNGVPDFYELQKRTMLTNSFKITLANSKYPASFVAYDIICYGDKQVTSLPLIERKKLLEEVVNENTKFAISRYIPEHGIQLFELADKQKLEGVVAKEKMSKYYFDKRTKEWIKFKRMADEDFVICGYKENEANGYSLILGQYKNDTLVYKGSVTLGVKFDILKKCTKINYSPFHLLPSEHDNITFLKPEVVCVVEYMPNTKDALRQPVLKGIRDDVLPKDCKVK